MGQKKLIRFEAIKSFPNVLQYPENMPGKWGEGFFEKTQPLTLELACGKGEYTVGLAQMYPGRNFLGVDLKGNRIYIGAKKCLAQEIKNAGFLRTKIDQINQYFNEGEVDEIWLTFPDPQLRKSRATRRLTHPKFLRLYQKIIKPGGLINLKTDSPVLYTFTKWVIELCNLTVIEDLDDIHAGLLKNDLKNELKNELKDKLRDELRIVTHYESLDIARSKRIHYLCFALPSTTLPDIDELLHARLMEIEKGHEPGNETPDADEAAD